MENKKKIAYIAVSVLLVLTLGFAIYAYSTGLFDKKDVNSDVQTTYTLSVSALGENIYEGEVTAYEGAPLFDSMLKALTENEIEVIYENGDYGAYITAIGGHAQDYDKNLYWTFTVNGEMTTEGASSFAPKNGDKVLFALEEISW